MICGGAVRQTSPSISIHLAAIFYEITKERCSVRAASRLSLNVLRFWKILDENYKSQLIGQFTLDNLKAVSKIFT